MKLLAIDTSTEIASIALQVGEEIFSAEQLSQKNHAQWLLPAIDRLMVEAGLLLHQLDAIVFGCGPGSFTGLRITCSIAKGLAYAKDLPLIPVSSLSAIAYLAFEQQQDKKRPVLAVLDARMQQMYWAYFDESNFFPSCQVSAVQEILLPQQQELVLAGVGIEEYSADFPLAIQNQIQAKITVYPKAQTMIRLSQSVGIQAVSAAEAQPLYVRNQIVQGQGERRG